MVDESLFRYSGDDSKRGHVQSVDRSLQLLDALADMGGIASLSDLVVHTSLPVATIHRLIGTMRDAGYVRQEANRQYALGVRLVRLGESASRLVGDWVKPTLQKLVDSTGETANMAMLDGNQAIYMAGVPSPHMMRMFTEVGRRVGVHNTAVGKALVACLDDATIMRMLETQGMRPDTEHTITNPERFLEHIRIVREAGYATDEQEKEAGVRCVAVARVVGSTPIALSVSGPEARFTVEKHNAAVTILQNAANSILC